MNVKALANGEGDGSESDLHQALEELEEEDEDDEDDQLPSFRHQVAGDALASVILDLDFRATLRSH